MNNKILVDLFKSYKWNELYEIVKNSEYDSNKLIELQFSLAFRGMLMAVRWSDSVTAKEILDLFPKVIKNPLIHFLVTYSYIYLADKEKANYYYNRISSDTPKWMKIFLKIEFLGKSLNFKTQINFIKKQYAVNSNLKNYMKVALLQTLENKSANTLYLQDFLRKNKICNNNNFLDKALCLRCNIIDINTIQSHGNTVLETQKAFDLLNKTKPVESLIVFDALANKNSLKIITLQIWLQTALSLPQGREYFSQRIIQALNSIPRTILLHGTIVSYALIYYWQEDNITKLHSLLQSYFDYQKIEISSAIKVNRIFTKYIHILHIFRHQHKELYENNSIINKYLYIFGESHSLSLANINIQLADNQFKAKSNIILGIKMYHLSDENSNFFKSILQEHLNSINNCHILFTIGEIDCRPTEGIWESVKRKKLNLKKTIQSTVNGYINFLSTNLKDKNLLSITIQGIPAPNYTVKDNSFLEMIKQVNEELKTLTLNMNWNFLDVYSATVDEDGKSNKKWHIDGHHLSPIFYRQADKYLITNNKSLGGMI